MIVNLPPNIIICPGTPTELHKIDVDRIGEMIEALQALKKEAEFGDDLE